MFAPRPEPARPEPRSHALPGPIGAALGLPAGTAAALITWALGGSPAIGLVLATFVAVAIGTLTTPVGAVLAAVQCWAFFDGFVLNRLGVLDATHPASLAIVAGGALAASLAGALTAPRAAGVIHRTRSDGYPAPGSRGALRRVGASIE